MTDIQAAVGREQLKRLPEMIARRRFLANRYQELLSKLPGILPPQEPKWARSNWQSYCVHLPKSVDQRQIMQKMLDLGVATRRGIMCAHREAAYGNQDCLCGNERRTCGCAPGTWAQLKESEEAQAESILLPLFHQMTEADQVRVVDALQQACAYQRTAA